MPPTLPCFTLEGKTCIVTGASQGLGQQILAAFSLSGANGAVIDLSLDSARQSIESINKEVAAAGLEKRDLQPYECNTADEQALKKTFKQIVDHFGKVDVVVTNAGITGGAPAEEYDFEEWKKMLDVNVNGTFLISREAGRYWLENKRKGVIMMVSSMSGSIVNVPQKQSAYNTSKAATAHMMKSFAAEWGPHGIRVNALSPGYIDTAANDSDEMRKMADEVWLPHTPLQRVAAPEEFRGTAVWMCSDASSFLTGSEIIVDGGYRII